MPQVSDQFIAHTSDTNLAILLNRDTFEPNAAVFVLFTKLRQARTREVWQFLWSEDSCDALPFPAPPHGHFLLRPHPHNVVAKKRDASLICSDGSTHTTQHEVDIGGEVALESSSK